MEFKHITRNIRLAPRKLRLVTDQVKHMQADKALGILPLVNKKAALHVEKSLKAAIQAAKDKDFDAATLLIQRISVDEGAPIKRMVGHSHGRMSMIMKKHSHLNIVLVGEQRAAKKAAARPAKVEQVEPSEEK